VAAWGENTDAEGNAAGQSQVPGGLGNIIAIAAGDYHSLAVTASGKVVAWGDNGYNQCGVPTLALSGVVAVAGGGSHSLALKTNGTVGVGCQLERQCSLSACIFQRGYNGGYHSVVLVQGAIPVPRLLDPAGRAVSSAPGADLDSQGLRLVKDSLEARVRD
jgi:alpha-tubulin suppressor-like RCC1 family protein